MKQKKIMIDENLFSQICQYFFLDHPEDELKKNIKQGLENKLNKIVEHELYSKSINSSLSENEREAARKEYLDMKGIPNDYRWDAKYQNGRLK